MNPGAEVGVSGFPTDEAKGLPGAGLKTLGCLDTRLDYVLTNGLLEEVAEIGFVSKFTELPMKGLFGLDFDPRPNRLSASSLLGMVDLPNGLMPRAGGSIYADGVFEQMRHLPSGFLKTLLFRSLQVKQSV